MFIVRGSEKNVKYFKKYFLYNFIPRSTTRKKIKNYNHHLHKYFLKHTTHLFFIINYYTHIPFLPIPSYRIFF